jgi:hypothetical protein
MLQNHPMYVYIPARDLPRAHAFYEEKVGLGALTAGGAKAAWFKDSEGNTRSPYSWRPRRPAPGQKPSRGSAAFNDRFRCSRTFSDTA